MIEGTAIGTNTDMDGYYEIEVPEHAVLEFSSIGYMNKSIKATNKTSNVLNVTLLDDEESLMGDIIIVKGRFNRMYSRKPVKKCTKEKRHVRH